MKKVLIYSLYYYPNMVGGAEVAIKEITDRISRDEYEFDMVCLKSKYEEKSFEKIDNVKIYRVGLVSHNKKVQRVLDKINKVTFFMTGLFKGLSLTRKKDYSLIWSIIASYNSFAAVLIKRVYPKIPFLLTLQEGDPPEQIKRKARIVWPLFKDIFKKADHVQAISTYLLDFARDMGYEFNINNYNLIPNGVDFELFSKEADVIDLGFKEDDFVLFTSSRLVVKNNLGIVIEALSKLPENFKFVIAGKGPLENDLKKQVNDLNLNNRVIFLGHIDQDKLPAYQFACNAFIRPSLSEGFGNSFIEAMASRLPVIASDRGGIPDFIFNRQNGIVVDPENVEEVVYAVKTICEDKDLRNKIIENAYQMVKDEYDWSIITRQMKNVFDKVSV